MSGVIVVESPSKTATLAGYLKGKGYQVLACYGHVRDLPSKQGAVDTQHDFSVSYEEIERNQKHIDAIAKAVGKADTLLLATDPDREGEAIAWHVVECLKRRGVLKGKKVIQRIKFYEITRSAILSALEHPEPINEDLLNAWKARRILDYLFGFSLSPLLWVKVQPGLSAGRVQSPALRLIVDREEEIRKFLSQEYWTMEAHCVTRQEPFIARLSRYQDKKVEQFSFTSEQESTEVKTYCERVSQGKLKVGTVEEKRKKKNPPPPFMTSTLQQEAARKLRFSAKKTMLVAQSLYEGVETSEGKVGLITYMRTDSLNLSAQAVEEIRSEVASRFGKKYVPSKPNLYRSKAKNSQEAHEAIRVTSVQRDPASMSSSLNSDQLDLYELIWQRTLACQMIPATLNTVAVDLACPQDVTTIFRATGSTLVDPGFMLAYQEGMDEKEAEDNRQLPALKEGEEVALQSIQPLQHFTEPPPRYSEASLVKALEEYGIGRPSTYASILSTIQQRGYAELDNRRFVPSEIGMIVGEFLSKHFTQYVDYHFTAELEDRLDDVARGEKQWVPVLKEFWSAFEKLIKDKKEKVSREEVTHARHLGEDPKSGKPVSVRMGRYGPFAQIGTKEDEERPKFAGLLPNQSLHTITLSEALALFDLPRVLGQTDTGEQVETNIGRFGPYVKYGDHYVSLKHDDPHTITLERALEVIAEKQKLDSEKVILNFPEAGIQVLNGRFGPYLTDGKINCKIPKDQDPRKLTLDQLKELLAHPPAKKPFFRKKAKK